MLQISLHLTPRGLRCNVIFPHWDADSLYHLTLPQGRHHDGRCEDGIRALAGARPLEKENVSLGRKGGDTWTNTSCAIPHGLDKVMCLICKQVITMLKDLTK